MEGKYEIAQTTSESKAKATDQTVIKRSTTSNRLLTLTCRYNLAETRSLTTRSAIKVKSKQHKELIVVRLAFEDVQFQLNLTHIE